MKTTTIQAPLAWSYMGTGLDGTAAVGIIGAIHEDGTAELWEQLPNLGMVCHTVKTSSLIRVKPIHPLPQPIGASDYNHLLDELIDAANAALQEHISSSDELRRIADRLNFVADFVDYVAPNANGGQE